MTHTPHDLAAEFPEHAERLHALKARDAHFRALADSYARINQAVHLAETDLTPTDDRHMAAMRQERMHLKDAIFAALRQAA